ncbi:hypothetical protein [Hallella absiana]|uniref:hypothetical protein n=1 Tax=Hallella absiana TaxID=2925336 RepID=UPI0021CABA01|nr:hypothetical protein [Hallella absiana]
MLCLTPVPLSKGEGSEATKKNLGENVEMSQKLRIFAAELMCGPPHVFAGHSRVVAVG